MTAITLFDSRGEIDRVVQCPDGCVEVQAQPGERWVFGDYGHASVYLDDAGVVTPKGEQPSPWHSWTAEAHAWELDLDRARAAKWAEVKSQRDAREFGLFSWDGHVFDGDQQSQSRINQAALGAYAALTADQPWSIEWTLADNASITLTAADMVAVAQALGANINAAHADARLMRAAIESATTVAQLEAVDWPT